MEKLRILSAPIVVILALVVLGAVTLSQSVSAAPGDTLSIVNNGEEPLCEWVYEDPITTEDHWSACSVGFEEDPDDPSKCKKCVEGGDYDYTPKVIDTPGSYGTCPDGYSVDPDNEARCRKKIPSGYWSPIDRPITKPSETVCPVVSWETTKLERCGFWCWRWVTYSITFTYDKDESDPHKCHRPPSAKLGNLGSPPYDTWPGSVKGKFRKETAEFLPGTFIPPVYGECPVGSVPHPTDEAKCQVWIDTSTWDYVDRPYTPPTYVCPAEYKEDPDNVEQCRKFVPESTCTFEDRTFIEGTTYCGEGFDYNEDTQVCEKQICSRLWCLNGQTFSWPVDKDLPVEFIGATLGECKEKRRNWEAPCPDCDLDLPPNTEAVSWATAFGPTNWDNNKTDGDLPPGVRTSVVVDDYEMIHYKDGWTLRQWLYLEYNQTALGDREVTLEDNGVMWQLPECEMRYDGNCWVKYMARVCNVNDKDRTQCHSSNDQIIRIDGVRQHPYTSSQEPRLWYQYWECSLTPSYAMTKFVNGKWQMEWHPGQTSWASAVFAMKADWRPWPLGWPEDRTKKSWIWHEDPLKTTNLWAIYYGHELIGEKDGVKEYKDLHFEFFDLP